MHRKRIPITVRLLFAGFIAYVAVCQVTAASDDVYVRAETMREDTETVSVSLFQSAIDTLPSTLVLLLTFDSAKAEPIALAASKTDRWSKQTAPHVRLAPAHQADGVRAEAAFHKGVEADATLSCFVIVVYQPGGMRPLQPGALLSFSLRFEPWDSGEENFWITPVTPDKPLVLNGNAIASSAAALNGRPLSISMEPFVVGVHCRPPDAPQRVRASLRYRDYIMVTWQQPEMAGDLEYRVYRSSGTDVATAVPAHDGWRKELSYEDTLKNVNDNDISPGCACTENAYYYWVRARDGLSGCESAFSAPAARGALRPWWLPVLWCNAKER